MKVATFIPLTKQRKLNTLTYFTEQDLKVGQIYSIPVRHSTLKAVLTELKTIEQSKAELRNNSFNLKPLPKISPEGVLPEGFVLAANDIADFYAGNTGTVLKLWLTKFDVLLEPETSSSIRKLAKLVTSKSNTTYWQIREEEFISQIERLLRKKNPKIALVVSDNNQLAMMAGLLNQYQPLIINGHSKQSTLDKIKDHNLIIATRSFGPLLNLCCQELIFINPGGDSWREQRWPNFMWDQAGIMVANKLNKPAYIWSQVLDARSWHDYCQSKSRQTSYVPDTYPKPKAILINRNSGQKNTKDVIFDPKIQKFITDSLAHDHKSLLYVTRRGLYPVLICQDCKQTSYTHAFKQQLQRYQIATSISDWVNPSLAEEWVDRCEHCGSWRLQPIAISLEQVKQVLAEMNLLDRTFIIDTITQTKAESRQEITNFYNHEGGALLLTTQRGAYNLTKPITNTIIVSLDAALSTSSLTVESDMLRLMYYLDFMSQKNFFIQSRLEDNPVIETFLSGTIRKYQNHHLEERQKLNFPPYYIQIKIKANLNVDLPHQSALRKLVVDDLAGSINQLPGLREGEKIILISINSETWQQNAADGLKNYLSNISLNYSIIINPDILL